MLRHINYKDYLKDKDSNIYEQCEWVVEGNTFFGTIYDFVEHWDNLDSFLLNCEYCGKEIYLSKRDILKTHIRCKTCSKIKYLKYENSLASKKEVLEMFLRSRNDANPRCISVATYGNKYKFTCSNNHEFKSSASQVVKTFNKGKEVCPYCSNQLVLTGYNDFATKYPNFVKYWDYDKNELKPEEVLANSSKMYFFKCENGHSSFRHACEFAKYDIYRCRDCKDVYIPYKPKPGKSFLDYYPKLASCWGNNEYKPEDVSYNCTATFEFICKNNHKFYRSLHDMGNSDAENSEFLGCPYCSGMKLLKGYNDFKSQNEEIDKYWGDSNTEKPDEVINHSGKEYYFKCPTCGKEHKISLDRVIKSSKQYLGCPYCTGREIITGYNDLYTYYPDIVDKYWDFEKNDLDPKKVSKLAKKYAWFKCVECNKSYQQLIEVRMTVRGLCPECTKKYTTSIEENNIYEYIKQYFPEAIQSWFFKNKSYDIFIPSKKFVIEYNGLYWHSEAVHDNKNYHFNKYKLLNDNGYNLFVIWEDDWRTSKEKIINTLNIKLGISQINKINARECTIKNENVSSGILEQYHIQGNPKACNYLIMYYNNEAVSELAYKVQNGILEIVRFASKYIVRGSFTKFLSYLECNICDIHAITTFSDNSISNGELYKNSGFELLYNLDPDYYYYYNDFRYHKFLFRKDRFKSDDMLKYDNNMTESELASLNGILRIWDYGKKKWIKYLS